MASITTVISFFILLLATFSYSAPIGQEYEYSTPDSEYTTYQPIVERADKTQAYLPLDDESTSMPMEKKDQSSEEKSSYEVTTEDTARPPRVFNQETYPSSTEMNEKYSKDYSYTPSTDKDDKRSVDDHFYATMESSTEFDRRAIRPLESGEDMESTTSVYSDKQMEMTTDVEPSSSVNSFGKYTGLLADEPSTTPEYEPTEESPRQKPLQTQRLTKTVSIIPGKITETKIYANLPSKTSVMIQPVEQEQLSQVQYQSNIKKTKSDN